MKTEHCPKCGLPLIVDDDVFGAKHASNGECVKALKSEVERLRGILKTLAREGVLYHGCGDCTWSMLTARKALRAAVSKEAKR